ncbi:hypothetical protein ILUMI_14392 [Ignelater luminosus]|uniref:Uncharacterized protein n=1 Tax=Ignelater luminosus TaxID=2038154 RepID=A0A8K0GAI3_IGNLU|nr:hypothetical protein ILUMI_14392 [Ignelater luminosus]
MLTGKEYLYLFTIRENKTCGALHKYLGEFLYDIERGMGHIPRVCPIPKDTYHLYNLPIDGNKIATAANFPFGNLRLTVHVLDNKNTEVSCVENVAEHSILQQ